MWPFKRKRTFNLDIFMRSGNVIKVDDVVEYDVKNRGSEVISLKIIYHPKSKVRLMISTIDLEQIEGIVCYD